MKVPESVASMFGKCEGWKLFRVWQQDSTVILPGEQDALPHIEEARLVLEFTNAETKRVKSVYLCFKDQGDGPEVSGFGEYPEGPASRV